MNPLSLLLVSAVLGAAPNSAVLDFTAKWCGPCQQMKPIVHALQRQGYPIREVDVDQHRDLAQKYGIRSIPCFVLVIDGQEVTRITGGTSKEALQRLAAMVSQHQQDSAVAQTAAPPARRRPPQTPRTFAVEEPPAAPPREEKKPAFQFPLVSRTREAQPPRPAGNLPAAPPVIRAKLGQSDAMAVLPTSNGPLASAVRIRTRETSGMTNFGSGTVIDSRSGRSIVLTCGHIFAKVDEKAPVEVDLFRQGEPQTFVGQILGYDAAADVGLIAIPTETPVPVSVVASAADGAQLGQTVYSIGCGGGEPPTRLDSTVTHLNRYKGPDNIECTGMPQEGRSGGGLFNAVGQVVGVCFAADPKDHRGLYCGLKPIHALLDRAQLSDLYRHDEPAAPADPALAQSAPAVLQPTSAVVADPAAPPAMTAAAAPRFASNSQQTAAVREITRNSGEVEVTCILRPLDDPQGRSRVVVIHRASEKFLSYLNGEIAEQPQPTALQVPTDVPQRYRRSAASR